MKVCACTGCSYCGSRCPKLTASTRCEGCSKAKRRASDRRRPGARERGYTKQHERDRDKFFSIYPLCQWHEGCIERATDLDHIDGNPFNRSWSNYRGLCGKHHKMRTAQDQPGGWAA